MSKMRVAVLVASGVVALMVMAFKYGILPQRYDVVERPAGVNVFWHEAEAFVFIHQMGQGHRRNWLTDHAPGSLRATLILSGVEEWHYLGQSTRAYHIAAGRLEAHTLEQTPMVPSWDLEDGHLVARPRLDGPEAGRGFRWTGSGFDRVDRLVPEAPATKPASKELAEDDVEEQGDATDRGPLSRATRDKLKGAGWHFKTLSGYEGSRGSVELPIDLGDGSYSLSLRATEPVGAPSYGRLFRSVSISLAGKTLQPSSQVLLASGDATSVSRQEFERLVARSAVGRTSQRPRNLIAALGGDFVPVVGAVLAVWLMLKGPTRGLKIAFVVFALVWVAPSVATAGWRPALTMLAIPLAIGAVTMLASTRLVRYRVKRTLVTVGESACPSYAQSRIRELTAAFEAAGFRFYGDRQSKWQMMSQDRRTFIRFLRHDSGYTWAEIQATDEPKTIGRMLTSIKDGTAVFTCDLQSNQELMRDPRTLVQRVARATSCADMLTAHETFVMTTPGTVRTIEDPVAADAEAYDRWVGALVRSKQVTTAGDWYKISPRAAIPITLRVMGAWFH